MKPHRTRQLGELLQRELAGIIQTSKEYCARGCLVTITEVRLSKDLKYADVWVSILGSEMQRSFTMRKLTQKKGRIRHHLAGRVVLRKLPELRFELDETLDYASKIDRLLDESGVSFDEGADGGEEDDRQT